MALPLILSLLGSGAAGAGMFGAMSPLIAGAIGSGIGSAIETGDIGEGIKTGLVSGLTGGVAGSLVGGASGAAPGMLAETATQAAPAAGGLAGMFQNIPSGMSAATPAAAGLPMRDMLRQGLNQGVLSGAGLGTALGGAMMTQPAQFGTEEEPYIPRATPMNRSQYAPPSSYRPGMDGEFRYFGPRKMANGGRVELTPAGMAPIAMQAGGLADIAAAQGGQGPMNEKAVVEGTIAAVQGRIPEEQAAPILAQFVQMYGEDALRKLVDDVQMGRMPQAQDGQVRGPGDGMADMVPAEMDGGGPDVLLSDGEFVVPADVVSGLGNGSTDAGAAELDRMMARVREARTGKTAQPKAVASGGVLPA